MKRKISNVSTEKSDNTEDSLTNVTNTTSSHLSYGTRKAIFFLVFITILQSFLMS